MSNIEPLKSKDNESDNNLYHFTLFIGQFSFGQDLNVQKYETSEYIMYYDKDWSMEMGNNLIQWYIKDQTGGTQYNLVIEVGLKKLNNSLTLYSIAAMNNLPKIISNFELIDAWEVDKENAVMMVYKSIAGNKLSTYLQYYILQNDKAYILTSRFDGEIELAKLKELSKLMTYLFHLK